jgi:hypothetical protein
MSVSGTDFLLNLMNDIFSCRFFSQLPRLDGSRTKVLKPSGGWRFLPKPGLSTASLLASKQPGALLAKLCV